MSGKQYLLKKNSINFEIQFKNMSQPEKNRKIALRWIEAFNEHDLEKLLALYADDAVHFSPKLRARQPETNGWLSGKAAMRLWWHDAFDRLPTLKYVLTNLIVEEKQLLMEYERHVQGEPIMKVAEILEIREGRIVGSRVYHG